MTRHYDSESEEERSDEEYEEEQEEVVEEVSMEIKLLQTKKILADQVYVDCLLPHDSK